MSISTKTPSLLFGTFRLRRSAFRTNSQNSYSATAPSSNQTLSPFLFLNIRQQHYHQMPALIPYTRQLESWFNFRSLSELFDAIPTTMTITRKRKFLLSIDWFRQ